MTGLLKFEITSEHVDVIDLEGYETRHESTINLFFEALEKVDIDALTHKFFFVNTNDISYAIEGYKTFGYTTSPEVIPCPDFSFDKWPEVRIESYTKVVNEILEKGIQPYRYNKLFWIGSINTQPIRSELVDLGNNNQDKFEIRQIDWAENDRSSLSNYVSLPDHTHFKYLIDCGAGGFSARLKFLLHSNRPLFLANRANEKQDFFFQDLNPYVHFIPVRSDLKDLLEKFDWAEENYEEAKLIASNAKKFAVEYLNRESAIRFLASQITKNLAL